MSSATNNITMDVEIGDVTPANIEQLKTINVNTLPGMCQCAQSSACMCARRLSDDSIWQ